MRHGVCRRDRPLLVRCNVGYKAHVPAIGQSINNSLVKLAAHRDQPTKLTGVSFDQGLPSIASLPKFFGSNGYSSPNDYLSGPFQYGHNTEMETYSYWLTQPEVIDNFNVFMQGGKLKKTRKWTGEYKVKSSNVPRLIMTETGSPRVPSSLMDPKTHPSLCYWWTLQGAGSVSRCSMSPLS